MKLLSEFKIFCYVDLFIGMLRGIDIILVRRSFFKILGVKDVYNFRLWLLLMDKIVLLVYLVVGKLV